MSISEIQIRKIVQKIPLSEVEQQIIKSYLRKTKIHKLSIRENLCEQGYVSKRGYYLLDGIVTLSTALDNNEIAVLSQITGQQFLNLQVMFNNWKSKYTITVVSPIIKYVIFDEKQIQVIGNCLKQQIGQSIKFRQTEKNRKNKKVLQKQKKRRMDEQITKLKLPDINYQSILRYPNLVNNQPHSIKIISTLKSQQRLPIFSKSLKSNFSKRKPIKSLQKVGQSPDNLENSDIKVVQQKLLNHYHQYQDKVGDKKIERLKSERSISLNQRSSKQINYSRNEKLFKEHLKQIVKRKLLFERKHFKILKKLNNNDHIVENSNYQRRQRQMGQQENPLDNYFDI